jgi:hypothetical protein
MTSAESQKRSGEAVSRRYSDFVWLLDCLSKRYVSGSSRHREDDLTVV